MGAHRAPRADVRCNDRIVQDIQVYAPHRKLPIRVLLRASITTAQDIRAYLLYALAVKDASSHLPGINDKRLVPLCLSQKDAPRVCVSFTGALGFRQALEGHVPVFKGLGSSGFASTVAESAGEQIAPMTHPHSCI